MALGTDSKHDLRCERPYCCSLIVFPKRNNGTVHRSAGVTASFRTLRSPKLSSLRPSPPRASVRAPCVHVSPYSSPPALLHQRRLPRSLRSHAETSVAAGGLGEECTLGQKLHFSFTQRQFLHRFQALANPFFVPTLSAAGTQASLENRNKHNQKKGSPRLSNIYITSNDLTATRRSCRSKQGGRVD